MKYIQLYIRDSFSSKIRARKRQKCDEGVIGKKMRSASSVARAPRPPKGLCIMSQRSENWASG